MEGGEKKKVVMVAIDSSECSHYALEWALHNSLLNSDQLLIFTVQPISDLNYLVASSMGSARKFTLSFLDFFSFSFLQFLGSVIKGFNFSYEFC